MKTTLNKIRKYEPCIDGWQKLLAHLGKTKADDEPLSIATIIDSNGLDDAIWCLRAVEGYDREIRLFAVWCARQVQHLMTDKRSLDALDVAERYANGKATEDELNAARAAAWAARDTAAAAWSAWAAEDAAWAARAAADVAGETARYAAGEAARYAANATAYAATTIAAADAAVEAAREKQEAELRRICGEW